MLKNLMSGKLFRPLFALSVILIGILSQSAIVQAVIRDGQLDRDFSVSPISFDLGGSVAAFAQMPDGKVIIAGGFSSLGGINANAIARMHENGSVDPTFRGEPNAGVSGIFPLSDGKILISGNFSRYGGITRNRIARLNSDGSLDPTFNPDLGTGYVQIAAVQPDGKIIISGVFTAIAGVPRNGLARLHPDGTLDLTFNVGSGFSNSGVNKAVVLADGKILFAGTFNSFDNVPRNGIVKLNPDGSADSNFASGLPGTANEIFDMSIGSDGKICVVGSIASQNTVFRLNADGSLDESFNTGNAWSSGRLYAVLVQPDGKVLVGGSFDSIYSNQSLRLHSKLARFNQNGSFDNSFTAKADDDVRTFKPLADNKILVGGLFSSLNTRKRGAMGRLNPDGSLDTSFAGFVGTFTTPSVFHILPDGKILLGGAFDAVGTSFKQHLARLNADGSVDESFTVADGVSSSIHSMGVQPDGKIILGGYSGGGCCGSLLSKGIWRINSDGSLDAAFNAQIAHLESVRTIAVQADGKILIGGNFTQVNGIARRTFARLNQNGGLDQTFNPEIGGLSVSEIVIQPDGNILVGGSFSSVNGIQIANIVRLKPDGTIDTSFNIGSGAGSSVSAILLTASGKIFVGGGFSNFNGVPRRSLLKLNSNGTFDESFKPVKISSSVHSIVELPDNKLLIGGTISSFNDAMPREQIIRLLEDGTIDYSFDVGRITQSTSSGTVYQLALLNDGKILSAGYFDAINGVARWGIMRLNTFARVSQALFDYDGDGKSDITVYRPSNGTWYRRNSYFNQFQAMRFGTSEDKIIPADFDGDFRTDVAVFRPSNGSWFIQKSGDNSVSSIQFGANGDIPVAKDFDGDGKADLAVFRPSNGTWYLLQSRDGFTALQFGAAADIPTVGDFDGDGKADISVFRPSNGTWYRIYSGSGTFSPTSFGQNGDTPTQGDFDGDLKTDLAVFRPSNSTWYILQSSEGFRAVQFGADGDKPVVADYDGDEKSDIAVFRTGTWYALQSSNGTFTSFNFGLASDVPLTAPLN